MKICSQWHTKFTKAGSKNRLWCHLKRAFLFRNWLLLRIPRSSYFSANLGETEDHVKTIHSGAQSLPITFSLSLSLKHTYCLFPFATVFNRAATKSLSHSLYLFYLSLFYHSLFYLSLSHSIVRSTFLKWCNRQKKKKKCNRQLFVWAEAATWRMLKILRRTRKWKISLSDNFERRVGQLFRLELLNLKKAFDESGRDVRRRPDGGAGPQIYYNFFAPSLRAP